MTYVGFIGIINKIENFDIYQDNNITLKHFKTSIYKLTITNTQSWWFAILLILFLTYVVQGYFHESFWHIYFSFNCFSFILCSNVLQSTTCNVLAQFYSLIFVYWVGSFWIFRDFDFLESQEKLDERRVNVSENAWGREVSIRRIWN